MRRKMQTSERGNSFEFEHQTIMRPDNDVCSEFQMGRVSDLWPTHRFIRKPFYHSHKWTIYELFNENFELEEEYLIQSCWFIDNVLAKRLCWIKTGNWQWWIQICPYWITEKNVVKYEQMTKGFKKYYFHQKSITNHKLMTAISNIPPRKYQKLNSVIQ